MTEYLPQKFDVRPAPTPAPLDYHTVMPERRPSSQPQESVALEIDISEMLAGIWRRRWTVVLVAFIGMLIGIFVALMWTPSYTGQVQIMLAQRSNEVLDNPAILSRLVITDELVETEIEVVSSRNIKEEAVVATDLIAELERRQLEEASSGGIGSLITSLMDWLDAHRESIETILPASIADRLFRETDAEGPLDMENGVRFIGQALDAQQVGNTSVMQIRVTDRDRFLATNLANAIAQAYLNSQIAWKQSETSDANAFLDARISDLRGELVAKRAQLQELRTATGAIGDGADSLLAQRRLLSNERALTARNDRIALETNLEAIEGIVQGGDPDQIASMVTTPLMLNLRSEAAIAAQRLAEVSAIYGERHPTYIDARESFQRVRTDIAGEAQRFVTGLRTELAAAQRQESLLQAELAEQNVQDQALDVDRSAAQALESEIAATQELLDDYLTRYKETEEKQAVIRPDARIITAATPPIYANAPSRSMIVAGVTVLAGMFGLVIALFRDMSDRTFRTLSGAETAMRLPVVAAIPLVKAKRRGALPIDYVTEKPASALAESVRKVITKLDLHHRGDRGRFLMVTSAVAGEGKSTVVGIAAQQLARTGSRTIVVECDLRRPTQAKTLRCNDEPGLLQHLRGREPLENCIQTSSEYGMDLLAAGAITDDPLAYLQSRKMRDLLISLSKTYDFVILDTAPVVPLPDAQVLADYADVVLYLCRWGRTARETAAVGSRMLLRQGGAPVFAALTHVDMKRYASYDSVYRDPSLRSYYVE